MSTKPQDTVTESCIYFLKHPHIKVNSEQSRRESPFTQVVLDLVDEALGSSMKTELRPLFTELNQAEKFQECDLIPALPMWSALVTMR